MAGTPPRKKGARYERKRDMIIDAAARQINLSGISGLTLSSVGEDVGLSTTSITYYFKRREQLVAAALSRAIDELESQVAEAGREPTPQTRVSRLIDLSFEVQRAIRRNMAPPQTDLSNLINLPEALRADLSDRYMAVFWAVRDFFEPDGSDRHNALCVVRAHVLMNTLYWLPAWLREYSVNDFARLSERLTEIFQTGIAPADSVWSPPVLEEEAQPEDDADEQQRAFLRAATRLMNERGYKGASVEDIASELNVTKGSFYHHLSAKDELVNACFARSYRKISYVQRAATALETSYLQRLSASVAALLDIQFFSDFPLLRVTSLTSLPIESRIRVVDRSNRVARRFAGMLIDGIADGSVRPVDPLVASQTIMAMLNSATALKEWAGQRAPEDAIEMYAGAIMYGLFRDPADTKA